MNNSASEIAVFASRVGQALLENGSETSRVEDTVERIINHFFSGTTNATAMLTSIFVTVGECTVTSRVKRRTINLDRIAKINAMSRDIVEDKIDFNEAVEEFERILKARPYSLTVKTLAYAICCMSFTLLFGGGFFDALSSFVVGMATNLILEPLRRSGVVNFMIMLCGGAFSAMLISVLYIIGLGENLNQIITGAVMPLVPGLAMTNAIRDIVVGDYISGSARAFDAVIMAVALAVGAGGVMYLFGHLTGGVMG